jgi:hypothetical protein
MRCEIEKCEENAIAELSWFDTMGVFVCKRHIQTLEETVKILHLEPLDIKYIK